MATFLQQEEDENKQADGQQTAAPQASQLSAPAAAGGQTSAANTRGPSVGSQPAPTSSGQFTDLGKYYEASKGLAGQQQQQVVGGLQGQVKAGEVKIGEEVGQYKQRIQGQQLSAAPFQGRSVADVDQAAFQGLFGQAKFDPADITGIGQLKQTVGTIGATAEEAGRRQALRSIAGKGYSSGELGLDALLLNRAEMSSAQTGGPSLAALRSQYTPDYVQRQAEAATGQIRSAQEAVQAQRAGVQEQARNWLRNQQAALQAAARTSAEQRTEEARRQLAEDLRGEFGKALEAERARVDAETAKLNAERQRQIAAAGSNYEAALRRGQAVIPDVTYGPSYKANYSVVGGIRTAEDALRKLAEQGYDPGRIQLGAQFSPEQSRQLDALNALGSAAGVGTGVDLGSTSTLDREAALSALRNLVRMQGPQAQLNAIQFGQMPNQTPTAIVPDKDINTQASATGRAVIPGLA